MVPEEAVNFCEDEVGLVHIDLLNVICAATLSPTACPAARLSSPL